MAKDSLLITNARRVNEDQITEADLRVQDGRIDVIAPSLVAQGGEQVLDAADCDLLSGCIDDQVHFREPGLTHKGDSVADLGYLRPCNWADLALVVLETPPLARYATVLYKCGWRPFDGASFRSSIAATLVNGKIIWRDGTLTGAIQEQKLGGHAAR